ncbi:type IVB secretion system protein IcmH/DotU [Thiocystis violascens]|uniref:Type IV / VI secretion system protein, DotU family n=1 Tax=Thiocystis violascens (strain ATCC 17096 / DSM 198 / 6111) TaxID=765911 RepID=I3YB80_THIV6|nr:type IVB secretion system protein IcmH/DotU [Thiocystis violascens]AFL74248.1 type IV / VI secretion system protein, DotU family [Thiocystis violascens DSM 198]
MTDEDPFATAGDAGHTIIRPMPGGRRVPGQPTPPPVPTPAVSGTLPGWNPETLPAHLNNPLVGCASGLLTVAAQVRGTSSHPDPEGLREGLTRQIREFEACARARGFADAVVLPARYVLCSLIDESVLDTPWGSQSVWSNRGLLISFHNEAWGGEKFFTALERLLAYPSGNLILLELLYLCLALGFEGRYRVREGGRDQLNRVREQLFQTIRAQRGDPELELSPHWRGIQEQRDPLIHQLPLWVFSAVSTLLLLALFAYFTFTLNRDSDPVYLSLGNLDKRLPALTERPRMPLTEAPPPDEPGATAPLTLRILLADEIAARQLDVVDRPQGQTVIIRGDDLFASGSVTVKPPYLPLLRRIAESLAQLPGAVLVTGHTDSVPIKTLRFPSNWHLSQERANKVRDLLVEVAGNPARFTAEGRADVDPLIAGSPKDARNRRVEVMLMTPARRSGEPTSRTGTSR